MSDNLRSHRSARVREQLERLRSIVEKTETRVYRSEMDSETYMNWTVIDTRSIKSNSLIPGAMSPFIDWCDRHCSERYMISSKKIYFESEDDSAFFLMVWK